MCDSYFMGWYVVIYYDMLIIVFDLGYCGIMFLYWFDGNDILNINIKYFFIFFL